jgi:hypothetical protein
MGKPDYVLDDFMLTRFMRKVEFFEAGKCWNWAGYLDKDGYGNFHIHRHPFRSHRLSLEWATGVKSNALVLHSCDNPRCVNPEHLRYGTQKENISQSVGRNRFGRKDIPFCKRGHPFVKGSYYIYGGSRFCKKCYLARKEEKNV